MTVVPATTSAGPTAAARMSWVDRLKIVVVTGVIVVHAATAYVVDISWYYEERTTSELTPYLLGFPVLTAGIFGLGPLFLVGGWLASASLARRGPRAFARARLLRLGLPALVYLAVIDPFTDWLGDRAEGDGGAFLDYLLDPFGDRDLGPVWFVAALLLFSLGYAGWRGAVPHRPNGAGRITVRPLAWCVLGIVVGDMVVWHWWGFFDSTLWNLNWAHWPQAAGLFTLGVVAGERGWIPSLPARFARACGRVAVAGLGVLMGLAGVSLATDTFESLGGTLSAGSLLFACLDGVTAVTLSIWVVAWFVRRWDGKPSPLLARAGRGAYGAYLLHPPVLVAISAAARPLAAPPELKFLLVGAVGVPACYLVGYLVSRAPWVNRVV
jgi:Acyltransferase family